MKQFEHHITERIRLRASLSAQIRRWRISDRLNPLDEFCWIGSG